MSIFLRCRFRKDGIVLALVLRLPGKLPMRSIPSQPDGEAGGNHRSGENPARRLGGDGRGGHDGNRTTAEQAKGESPVEQIAENIDDPSDQLQNAEHDGYSIARDALL